ncbi:MAG: cellulose biosynthesis cyclic di-GMP-binding regulatory protein BcsB [Candidatus Dormibacteraeota bacterium]|nr:cellulose biosynthesis cyclic di-GMP-binding regulatory protein BcsB [Candidatus Dormibacteraeota bacterium]
MFGVLLVPLALPARLASADTVVPPAVQELTLDSLGMGAQTVYGPSGVMEIYFPAPVAQLASSGSFVRLFFSYSSNLVDGSGAVITMNGQPLPLHNPVPLSNSTAPGGLAEYPVGPEVLSDQTPNRLRIQFTMRSAAQPPPSSSDLFGRLDGRTLIHYQLATPGGGRPAGLETYPFSLLPTSEQDRTVGVVLPNQPGLEEAGSALRVLADLGYRAGLRRPSVTLVSDDGSGWLASGGRPAVVVGRFDRLPAQLQGGSGWKRADRGLDGPGGRTAAQDDGVVAMLTSPWDHTTPIVMVTGVSDTALARATAALVGSSRVPLSSDVTVVTKAETDPPAPIQSVPVNLDTPQDVGTTRPTRYRSTITFAAPPVDSEGTTQLELRLPAFRGSSLKPNFVATELDGQRIGGTTIDPNSGEGRNLEFDFPGRMLRPGNNALTIDYQLQAPSPQAAAGGTPSGGNTVSGSLTLPRPPFQSSDLRSLPYPFFQNTSAHRTLVAITDASPATLGAAGDAMLSLGTRSAGSPPRIDISVQPKTLPAGSDAIVVGAPPASGDLAQLARSLPLPVAESAGTVQQVSAPGGGGLVLWVGGGKDTLGAAARALADDLRGQAVTVDGSGHIRAAPVSASPATSRLASFGLPKLLAVLAGIVLALTLGVQLVRPRGSAEL